MIVQVLAGLVNGAIVGGLGYLKTLKEDKLEEFEPAKLCETVVIGGLVGAVAGFQGVTYSTAQDWAVSSGAILGIDLVAKVVYRWIKRVLGIKATQ